MDVGSVNEYEDEAIIRLETRENPLPLRVLAQWGQKGRREASLSRRTVSVRPICVFLVVVSINITIRQKGTRMRRAERVIARYEVGTAIVEVASR